jgi:cytochrome c peroxidase
VIRLSVAVALTGVALAQIGEARLQGRLRGLDSAPPQEAWAWDVPSGSRVPRVPEDNPMTRAKVELGRHLFYDTRLSANQTFACATCHVQALAFADDKGRGVGSTGEVHPRGSMSLTNVGYLPTLTWANPNVDRLEEQALVPMFGEHPVELGLAGREDELFARLRSDARYQEMFAETFPDDADPYSIRRVTQAIAAFERTLISFDAPYDRYRRGDPHAMSAAAKRGEELFHSEKYECFHCHAAPFFTSAVDYEGKYWVEAQFFNTGLYNIGSRGAYPEANEGIYTFTGAPSDMGRFRPPTLRNIAVTAPYMHDGTIDTLDGVIDHYAAGGRTVTEGPNAGVGRDNPHKSGFVKGIEVTPEERADLLAFLHALTDSTFLTDPRFGNPWGGSR